MIGAAGRATLWAATRARSSSSPSSTSVSTSRTSLSSSIQSCRFTAPDSPHPGVPQPPRAHRVAQIRPAVDVAALVADRRHQREVEAGEQGPQRHPVLRLAVGAYGVEAVGIEHAGELAATVGVGQEGAVAARSRLAQAPEGPRRSPAACRPRARRACAAGGAGRPARSAARRPARRTAGSRGRTSPAAWSAPGRRRRPPRSASASASSACSSRVRPCVARPTALSAPSSRTARPPASTIAAKLMCGSLAPWPVCASPSSSRPPASSRRPTARPSTGSRPRDADLVVFPEAFARDFGEAGSDVSAYAEPLDGPFATEVARVAERARRDGGRRDVRAG